MTSKQLSEAAKYMRKNLSIANSNKDTLTMLVFGKEGRRLIADLRRSGVKIKTRRLKV